MSKFKIIISLILTIIIVNVSFANTEAQSVSKIRKSYQTTSIERGGSVDDAIDLIKKSSIILWI